MIHTRIRFLDPVDPREVFDLAVTLVDPVPNYQREYRAPGSSTVFPNWPLNPTIYGVRGQGDTHIEVEYGQEGSLLIEEWDDPQYADDYPPDQRGPRAYVELEFEGSGGSAYEKHGPNGLFWRAFARRFLHIAMWLQDDYSGTWTVPLLVRDSS